jgi:hypothetical protein
MRPAAPAPMMTTSNACSAFSIESRYGLLYNNSALLDLHTRTEDDRPCRT